MSPIFPMLGETLHILSAVCRFISNIMQKPPNWISWNLEKCSVSKVETRKIWCGCRSKSGSRNYHNFYLILQDWASFFHRLTNHQTNLMKLGEQGQRTSSLNSGWCPDHIIRNNKVRGMGTDLTGGRPECSSNIEFRIMITSTYSSLLYLAY